MEEKNQSTLVWVLFVIIVLLIGIIIYGYYYYNILNLNNEKNASIVSIVSSSIASTAPDVSATPTSTPTNSNLDVLTAKVGDQVGEMQITKIIPFTQTSTPPRDGQLSDTNAHIEFTGVTEITGEYNYVDSPLGMSMLNFSVTDKNSLAKLPKLKEESNKVLFNFIDEKDKSFFGPLGSSGTATIKINNYTINRYPSEVGNTAKLISVTNK